MTRIFNDLRSGIRSFLTSYLPLYLPASIIITASVYGPAIQADYKAMVPGLFLSFILLTCLPAIAAARGLQNAGHRLKSFSLIGGDALMVALLLYIIPFPSPDDLTSIALAVFMSGAGFMIIALLVKRGIHVAMGVERQGLMQAMRQIWQNTPGLLIRMGIGVFLSILSLAMANFTMKSLPSTDDASHLMTGLVLSSILVIPACFMPFILLAEGLKPVSHEPHVKRE